LTIFYSILTSWNSKFHIETWNLVKIEVVEQKKSYNFRFCESWFEARIKEKTVDEHG